MQDEVHEFTIHYHRQLRSKGAVESILDTVPGIGSKRKKELLKKYKTLTKIKDAGIEELSKIIPLNTAEQLIYILEDFIEDKK